MGKIRKFRLRDGDRIDSYAVVGDQSLGNGWEAEVYKVREVATAAIRAIKLVRRDTGTFSDWIHRAWFYEQLARTGSTVRYYHMGEWYLDGYEHVTYFVLEYLNGTTLKSWAKPKRRPSALDRVRMLSLLAGKIEVVHKRDFALGDFDHGENILVLHPGNEPVFIDWNFGKPHKPNRDFKGDVRHFIGCTNLLLPATETALSQGVRAVLEESKKKRPKVEAFSYLRDAFAEFARTPRGTVS